MHTTPTTRWNLVVSKETDKSLRQFLAYEGRSRKGELSRFVEQAVKNYLFDSTREAVAKKNAIVDPEELEAIVEESLAWTRK